MGKNKMIKKIKHASSSDIEVINDVQEIKFDENIKYYIIAKKDNLYVIQSSDGFNLIVDETIVGILKEKNILGGAG